MKILWKSAHLQQEDGANKGALEKPRRDDMYSSRCRYLSLLLISFFVLAVGCNRSKSNSGTGNSVNPTTPQAAATLSGSPNSPLPETPPQPEEYHVVDFAKTGLALEFKAARMEFSAKGWINLCNGCSLAAVDAHGHSMPIPLLSENLRSGGLQTKDFGIIKVRTAADFSGEYFMQDSHLKDLQKRFKEFVNPKQGPRP
jgi:hypothetical protein